MPKSAGSSSSVQAAGLASQQLKLLYLVIPCLSAVMLPGLYPRHDQAGAWPPSQDLVRTKPGAPLMNMLGLQLCLLAAHAMWLSTGFGKVGMLLRSEQSAS